MKMATGSSSEPEPGSPCFFKVVRYPSAPHLSLPIAFVRRYLDKIPKNPTLKTATGEHSWRLQLEKIGEDYCFAHGWEKLAKDADLRIRDILIFWLIDSFTFQVSFFDEHGCDKDLPLNNTSWVSLSPNTYTHTPLNWVLTDGSSIPGDGDEYNGEHVDDDDEDSVTPDEDLYFQKVISGKKTHRFAMLLPKKLVNAAGLQNKPSIILKDSVGKEWKIGLRTETYAANTKLYLSAGWPRFKRYHELFDGDMCLFKYIKKEGVLVLAQLIKSKRPTKPEINVEGVKRKVGRPRVKKLGGGDGGGGVKVQVKYDSGAEAEVSKRKRGRPLPEKHSGGGVEVKIEDESGPAEVEVVKKNRGGLAFVKACGGGVELKTEPETERVFNCSRVIYF